MAILLAFSLVTGIIGLAWRQADDPTIRKHIERKRLQFIAGKADWHISLREAEDALVLARRHGEKALVTRFAKLVVSLKKGATP